MQKINGLKIKEARKKLGLSQEKLANKIGVSKVTICWYENGERVPSLENFLKLSDELNLTLDELASREVSVVAEDEKEYVVKMPKRDIEIISEIRKKDNLYKKLYNDPKRTAELIERKLK